MMRLGISLLYLVASCTGIIQRACENSRLSIFCQFGQPITITSANYGRTEQQFCPGPNTQNTNCISPNSLQVVRNFCQGRTSCSMTASNFLFGDPCPGTSKYLEIDYECGGVGPTTTQPPSTTPSTGTRFVACESNTLFLNCPFGFVLQVLTANYGRTDQTTCPVFPPRPQNDNCLSPNSLNIVRNTCDGRNNCQIRASNQVFGDPCPGNSKYLELTARCRR